MAIHFKGLSEIRALASLFVVFHHIEIYKKRSNISNLCDTFLESFIRTLGENSVFVFFVLSGFLITFLLLTEKSQKNKIDIGKFYMRRFLRIWPLYYMIVLLAFTLIPFLAYNIEALQLEKFYYKRILDVHQSPLTPLILFLLFLPNIVLKFFIAVPAASHTWSIGVEEQFYLIWPNFFNIVKKNIHLFFILCSIAALPFISLILLKIYLPLGKLLFLIIDVFPVYFMAIGGIGAFILFEFKSKVESYLKNPLLFIINTVLLIIAFFIPIPQVLFALLTMFEILFIVQNHFKFNLRNKTLEKIGNISYGVYVYHPMVMYFTFAFFNSVFPIPNFYLYNFFIYVTIFGLTILISQLSYNYFESWFIQLKNKKYTVVASSNKSES